MMIKKNENLITFILVFSFWVLYGYFFTLRTFYYDAGNYWNFGNSFLGETGWKFLNFTEGLRGYLFPLVLYVVDKITPNMLSHYLMVVLFNAFLLASISVLLIPAIINSVVSVKVNWYEKALLTFFLFTFWRGYVFYPLSDFPAILLVLLSIFLFITIDEKTEPLKIAIYALLIGVFSGAAYYIRPVYLASVPVIGIGIAYKIIVANKLVKKVVFFFFFLGLMLVMLPQYFINSHNFGLRSPFISSGLYSFQLSTGFRVQKYESNVDFATYDNASVYFSDPQTENLIQRENVDVESIDIFKIIELFKKYPLDMTTVYFRHIFNGLNITYHTPYITDLYRPDIFSMILNYTIFFFVLFIFRDTKINIVGHDLFFLVAATMLPVLVAIPGAVEVRFFLPLHLFVYSIFIVYLPEPGKFWRSIATQKKKSVRYLFFYVFFVIAALSFSSMIATTIPDSYILLTPK